MKTALLASALSLALAGTVWASCITTYDADLSLYRTRCTNGHSFVTRYDDAFRRWRTEERPARKPTLKEGKDTTGRKGK